MFSREGGNFWESVSDLMTGLMMVFLFIALSFLYQIEQNKNTYLETKREIYADLSKEFSQEELKGWGAIINPQTMAVEFKEPDVLFDVGASALKPRFQEILNSFFPRYVAVLKSDKYKGKISEIRIEGHASKEWDGDAASDAAYLYNMKLSQDRARNVLQYVFPRAGQKDDKEWLKPYITANGLSYGHASDNAENDRRVEFRVLTDAEQELRKLYGEEIRY